MKSLIIALLLSSTTAVHHRHQAHHHSHHNALAQFGEHTKKPMYDQLLALNSNSNGFEKVQALSDQQEKGILEKVQQKMEREEKEKEQIKLAKEAQVIQEQAIKEAEIISQHKILRRQANQHEAVAQAEQLIKMIKKGSINAQQLSQIMLGQIDLANVIEEDAEADPLAVGPAPAPAPAPVAPAPVAIVAAPVALPTIPKEVVVEQAPQPKMQPVKAPEPKKAVEVVQQQKPQPVPEVKQKPAPEKQHQKPAALPQVATEARAEDLEDSISSIAQRVLEEKRSKDAQSAEAYVAEFKKDNSDIVDQPRKMTMSERAEQKYSNDPEEQKKQAEEAALDNPISEYFANKHPEVVKVAQERHYLTDQV